MQSISTLTMIIAVCWICYRLTSERTAPSPKVSSEGGDDAPEPHVATIPAERDVTLTARITFGGDLQKADRMIVEEKQTTGGHYVYVHKGAKGEIFYVGKGVGDRAYSKDRMPHWHHYVKTRCGGQHTVEIVRRFQSDEAALEFESDLIALYGHQLVNWVNSGRQTDLGINARFHKLRKANWLFIAETLPLESSDPVAAEKRYQDAITRVNKYATLVWEDGLVAELSREISGSWDCHLNASDLAALDRLTLLYKRQQRWQDLMRAADSFFAEYPTTRTQGISIRILQRRDAAEKKLQG